MVEDIHNVGDEEINEVIDVEDMVTEVGVK